MKDATVSERAVRRSLLRSWHLDGDPKYSERMSHVDTWGKNITGRNSSDLGSCIQGPRKRTMLLLEN